jgi:hypothetical protein
MFSCLASGNGLAGISVDEAQVSGIGGAVYPRIMIPVEIDYYALREKLVDYVFTGLDAQLSLDRVGKLADAIPLRLQRVQRTHAHYVGPEHLSLEFPIDARRVAEMERQRDGKDLALRIDFQLTVEEHRAIEGDQKTQRPTIWGVRCVLRLTAPLPITIPRTTWIDRVLPNTGVGVVHLIELSAVPIESCQAFKHSFDALQQAQTLHSQGYYDEAVSKCRIALEPFFDHLPVDPTHKDSRKIPVLKKSWETKLGKVTYVWLNSTLGAIKDAANPTAHSPKSHFDQFESQMLQAITTTLIAYAARTLPMEDKE